MTYFEDGDCPAYKEHLKNNRFLFRCALVFGMVLTLSLFIISIVGGHS